MALNCLTVLADNMPALSMTEFSNADALGVDGIPIVLTIIIMASINMSVLTPDIIQPQRTTMRFLIMIIGHSPRSTFGVTLAPVSA